jgi:hypothetical protein
MTWALVFSTDLLSHDELAINDKNSDLDVVVIDT